MTVDNILKRVAASVNGEAVTPAGDEYDQFMEFLNMAQGEWSDAYEFQVLRKVHFATMPVSGTSVALPANFKGKFAGYIQVNDSLLPELDPVEGTFTSGDYVTWGGNDSEGYYLNLSRALTSSASLAIPYHSRPTSYLSLTQVSICPDPNFEVARTAEMILLQRGQPEYVEFQNKGNVLLERLVANENTADVQKKREINTTFVRNNFTLGED